MDRFAPTVLIGIVFVGILVLMVVSWKRRSRRDAHLAPRPMADPGRELMAADGFYVATTVHERPLERLAPAGLGFRGRARLTVFAGGVSIAVVGAAETVIPATDIVTAAPATWAIDRVVERDGLVLLAWRAAGTTSPGSTVLDSYLRIVDVDERERLMAAIRQISTDDTQIDDARSEG